MRLAIIPARGGSKRIKNKNIINFLGMPMIGYTLRACRESGLFDKIHVSTDSDTIKKTSENLGFSVDFMRAPELADDHTPLMPVLHSVVREYAKLGQDFDTVSMIMPCAPLLEASDLIQAYRVFEQHRPRKPLMAVAPFPVPVEWAYKRLENGELVPVTPGAYAIRSQDLGKKYYDTGTFYFYEEIGRASCRERVCLAV